MSSNNNSLGEFKGTTKQAIIDIREDIQDLQNDVRSINNKLFIIFILLAIAVIERLPILVSALASVGP